jgi:hypothetical protein
MMLQLNPAFTNNLIESVRAKMPALGMDLLLFRPKSRLMGFDMPSPIMS